MATRTWRRISAAAAADTKKYTKPELAALPGGRYQAWRIEKEDELLNGDSDWVNRWREDVEAAVGRGQGAVVCVKELIDAAIDQGNELFAGTMFADTWWLHHDALSQWWEKEAQLYIASRGFYHRQVRAWGSTNMGTRYHRKLVGNRSEMMALDAHLFFDLKDNNRKNCSISGAAVSAGVRLGADARFKMGTPQELSAALMKTWEVHPTPERIVEDISRVWQVTVQAIVAHTGGIVPDAVLRSGRRKQRGKRPPVLHPDVEAAEEGILKKLAQKVKRAKT